MKTALERVNISVLNVGYARTQHKWGGADISSPFARLYYIKAGHACLHLPSEDVDLQPGYMYLVPGFMPHSYECEPNLEFYYMFIYERYGDHMDIFDIYDMPICVKADNAVELLFTNYCQLYPQLSLPYSSAEDFNAHPAYMDYARRYSQMERYEKMQLQGLVWIISSYFMKHAVKAHDHLDDRVVKVCTYVKQNIGKTIRQEQLEDVACLTRSHLNRLFHESYGMSSMQYVIRQKVQYAQQLLLTSDMSVSSVAEAIGISDTSYFIRLFRKQIGFTPQDYRHSVKY